MSIDCKQNISAVISKEQKDFLQLVIHEDAATSLSGAVQWCIDACMRIEKLYGVDACYVSFNDIRKERHSIPDTDPTATPSPSNNQREGEKVLRWVRAEEEPNMDDAFDVLCPFCNRPVDIDKNGGCICGAKISMKDEPTETPSLPVRDFKKEVELWLTQDMPEYLKDGRDKGRFAWEEGYRAATRRFTNSPSLPVEPELNIPNNK